MSSYFAHSLAASAAADFHNGGSDYPSAVQGFPGQAHHYSPPASSVNYSYNYGGHLEAAGNYYPMDRTSSSLDSTVPLSHPPAIPSSTTGVAATTSVSSSYGPPQHAQTAISVNQCSKESPTNLMHGGGCASAKSNAMSAAKSPQTAQQPSEQIYPWMRRIHSNSGKATFHDISYYNRYLNTKIFA